MRFQELGIKMAETLPPEIEQCFLIADYVYQQEPNIIRSDVDVGPAKTRRRHTKPIVNVKGSLVLSKAHLDIFDTFYNDVLQSGALRFLFNDPVSGTTKEYRFIDPPVYRPITVDHWVVELTMEILP